MSQEALKRAQVRHQRELSRPSLHEPPISAEAM